MFADSETIWIKNDLNSRLPSIYVDSWTGTSDDGKSYVCLFVELSPLDMQFLRSNDKFSANYEIDISIWDERKQRIKSKILKDSVLVDSYEEAGDYNWNRLYRTAFELPDGRFQAMIEIVDKNTGQSALMQQEVLMNSETVSGIDASDILIARRDAYGSTDTGTEDFGILPYPGKIYGIEQAEVFYYFEIYAPQASISDSVTYNTFAVGPDDKQTLVNSGRVSAAAGKVPVLHNIRVAEHPPGTYRLTVEVDTPDGIYQIERHEKFTVHQNPLDLRFKPYARVLSELEYMASEEELEKLRFVPEGNRQAAIYRFWSDRDPTPGTEKNELYLEYYERLYIAQRLYSVNDSEKSEITDQGKIFIMLGAPDEVLKYADKVDAFSDTQIWKYDSQHLKVVFRDEIGGGNYRLISPYSLLDN